jgi:recombination protein RecA
MSLDELLNDVNKKYKEAIFTKGISYGAKARIPFSSIRANWPLYGGVPRGKLVEFFGPESSGKTTACLDLIKSAQELFQEEWEEEVAALTEEIPTLTRKADRDLKQKRLDLLEKRGPQKVLFVDAENSLEESWAATLGIDVASLFVYTPMAECAEEIFAVVENSINTGEFGLVILDSLGTLVSKDDLNKELTEEEKIGGISKPLTRFAKRAVGYCAKNDCTFIGINQIRSDVKNPYALYRTPGGDNWRHSCMLRIMFSIMEYIDDRGSKVPNSCDNPHGHKIQMSIKKTKVCRPDRKLSHFTLIYLEGIDTIGDAVDLAIDPDLGLINKMGAWYAYGEEKFQGQHNVKEYFENNPEEYAKLYVELHHKMLGE